MKIAYVFDPILPHRDTDAEQALNTIVGLSRAGAEVELFLPRRLVGPVAGAGELAEFYRLRAPLRVTHLRSLFPAFRPLEKLAHAVRAAAHHRLRDFDIVYSRNLSSVIAALAWGHRVMYETYRPWNDQYPVLGPPLRAVMSRKNFVGAVLHSDYAGQKYRELGVDPERLEVVHNGYEPALFEPRLDRSEARRRLDLPGDRPIALYAGRMTMGKGLGIVLEMAARSPDLHFVLVGSQTRGEVERRAESLANVTVAGWLPYDELPAWLFAADVLILPPSLVGLEKAGDTVLPMKLFLYLAAGRPILAPRAPDTAELLVHDDNAWLVSPDDIDAAVTGLRQLIRDAALARRLAATAEMQSRSFTWEARAQKIIEFIDRRLGVPSVGGVRRAVHGQRTA